MLRKLFVSVSFICLASASLSGQSTMPVSKEQAGSFIKATAVKFLENTGQITDEMGKPVPFVLFRASAPGLDLYITEKGLTYIFKRQVESDQQKDPDPLHPETMIEDHSYTWERVDMDLKDALIKKENSVKENPEQGMHHYYLGHCPDGIRNVKQFAKITIKNIYPGIDWVLYNSGKNGFKYDFVVYAGADPSLIQLLYSSLAPLNLNVGGSLQLKNSHGSLTENAPYTYLKENTQKVNSTFKILSSVKKEEYYENLVGFHLGNFEAGKTLVIDPQLYWATTFGGNSNETITSMDHDLYSNLFVTGFMQGSTFPLQNSGSAYFQGTTPMGGDAFVAKFNASGILIWSTYYGGNSGDYGNSITVDHLANIFVTGSTQSSDFPVLNAGGFFQGTYAGGTAGSNTDGFILKFDNIGNRLWATYYGGTGFETPNSIHADQTGNIFICGVTGSGNLPLLNAGTFYDNAFSTGNNKGFILKFNTTTTRLWATYFGQDRCTAITTDSPGNVFVTGRSGLIPVLNPGGGAYFQAFAGQLPDAYIAKFDNNGNQVWATYYGGSSGDDYGKSIICDSRGNVFMAGVSASTNIPIVSSDNSFQDTLNGSGSTSPSPLPVPVKDAFITKFNSTGALVWSTYYGGTNFEDMEYNDNLTLDPCDRVYLAFTSNSTVGIATSTACESGYFDNSNSGNSDQFVVRFSNSGALEWASYLGGDGGDNCSAMDFNKAGALSIGGRWAPTNLSTYPFINPGGGAFYSSVNNGMNDGFIARFDGFMQNQPPAFHYTATCAGTNQTISPITASSFVGGGVFSAIGTPGSLNIDKTTGAIPLLNAAPGTYTVTYNWESCKCNDSQYLLIIAICDGISEYSDGGTPLEIFSNPNSGEFKVQGYRNTGLVLFNELGQVIGIFSLSKENAYQTKISGLSSGVYFLRTENETHKIIVIK